jgi:hypothetical protein
MRNVTLVGIMVLLFAGIACVQGAAPPAKLKWTPATLQAEIAALKAPRVAWREIQWKSCLLEGLQESRVKRKPVLLWVFIDRPVDDARC